MNSPRLPVAPTLALALACVGFALAGPLGLLAAVVVAASAVLPWPLPFALGQVAAAAVFGDPATATPPLAFLATQAGLWLALALSAIATTPTQAETGLRQRVRASVRTNAAPVAVASTLAAGLLVLVFVWTQGSLLAKAAVVAVAIAAVIYAVHRYERVTTGLVAR